eukprot:CAMPEP_0168835406 /NCGR_PEP_ID=MMETSP0727-20121128/4078_1 /TAXON_ID=265536 /ORGANISM="Amphiprora sp., Strain CCMP467" /LENGTH=1255 /DNA_ID=CAMNT_0008888763 /DNA_START=124 /DNA_END=3891 /DNA_ORIENTATION=-
MTGLEFQRPTGPGADVKELQYVIALQQTSPQTRGNATISSQDILALLRSRYALDISHEQALTVVRALGGGDTQVDLQEEWHVLDRVHEERAQKGLLHTLTSHLHPSKTKSSSSTSEKGDDDGHDPNGDPQGQPPSPTSSSSNNAKSFLPSFLSKSLGGGTKQTAEEATTTAVETNNNGNITSHTHSQLHHLKVLHRRAKADDLNTRHEQSMRNMKQDLIASLRHKVKSHHALLQPNENENENADDNGGAATAPMGKKDIDDDAKLVGAVEQPLPLETEEEKEEPDPPEHEPDVEFLDLVQTLTTLFIPTFARMTVAAANLDKTNGDNEEEERGEEVEPHLLAKLGQRFVNYGRRKLGLHHNALPPSDDTAQRLLDLAHQAMMRTILFDQNDDDDEHHEEATKHDSSHHPPLVVDQHLVQLLLLEAGEVERAGNTELVQAMVDIATAKTSTSTSDDGTTTTTFDRAALLRAVSSDLVPTWDPTCDDVPTTFFHDVFGEDAPRVTTQLVAGSDKDDDDDDAMKTRDLNQSTPKEPVEMYAQGPEVSVDDKDVENLESTNVPEDDAKDDTHDDEPPRLNLCYRCLKCAFPVIYAHLDKQGPKPDFTTVFGGIDMALDLSASLVTHMFIWLSFILIVLVYGSLALRSPKFDISCDKLSKNWCTLWDTVVNWAVIAGLLIGFGMYYMVPVSLGNSQLDRSPRRIFFAAFYALANHVAAFAISNHLQTLDDSRFDVIQGDTYEAQQMLTLAIGLALTGILLFQGLWMYCSKSAGAQFISRVSEGAWNGEISVYKAAQRKTQTILENAFKMHKPPVDQLHSAQTQTQTMRNFVLHGETLEANGGLFWSWWKFFDGSIFNEEGIWINTRLWATQFAQITLGVFSAVLLFWLSVQAADSAENVRDDLEDDDLPDWILEIFPTSWMVLGSLIPASIVACAVMAIYCVLYIPSSISTILKYRGHLYPSLGSPYFEKYRMNLDMTYMNMANAIYGMVGAAALFYIVVGLVIFLFVWPVTRNAAILLTFWGIGLTITIVIKMLITQTCRQVQYRAYFRVRPAAARISSLALECWFIGLAGSVLIARITQFLAAAMFWVGRIDVTFLSEDVSLFGYAFDYVPTHFIKDLLVHEAHRHPYAERLSQMYLMKLRHGDKFVSEAGSAWRQLIILTVFPWAAKYRVFTEERKRSALVEAHEMVELLEKEQEQFGGASEMAGGVAKAGLNVGGEIVEVGQELYGAGGDVVHEVARAGKAVGGLVRHDESQSRVP